MKSQTRRHFSSRPKLPSLSNVPSKRRRQAIQQAKLALTEYVGESGRRRRRRALAGGRGRSGPGGPARRFPDRVPRRPSPYALPKIQATDLAWGHELFIDQVARAPNIETGTKLYVSNLDYGVSNEDIKLFFLVQNPMVLVAQRARGEPGLWCCRFLGK